jgi:hypothetical protein
MEDPTALWYTIVPSKLVDQIKAFYAEFKCSIGSSSNTSLHVKSGVRQECMMSALLFIIAVDWVMRSTLSEDNTGIRWTLLSKLEDLVYADDLALLSHLETQMQRKHLTCRYQRKEN